ncbi:MAG: kynureninase [Spirochaetota bacterium]|nr:kynureninase [Spirochaetota bacterium]
MADPYNPDRSFAARLDHEDPLGSFIDRFYKLPDTIYMDGNSLGLLSRDAEETLLRVLNEWKHQGIDGWMNAEIPWFHYTERLAAMQAPMLGARAEEVIITSSTTINMHSLIRTLFKPVQGKDRILMDELNFPSDIYAVKAILSDLGLDPDAHLVLAPSRDGRFLDETELIERMDDDVAVALLPAVLYRSGQLLDLRRLTLAAHERDILIGFDCSHSVGAVPHTLDADDVDFAVWCNYKYMNNGPGGTAGLYINQRHLPVNPSLAGWWGYDKQRQFDMNLEFRPSGTAGAFQTGTPHLFSTAPLEGSLRLYQEAGIERLREKSIRLTNYFIYLLDTLLPEEKSGFRIGSPREEHRRGGHVAVEHEEAVRINEALKHRGVLPDFRYPNVIRLAPVPLYTRFTEVWDTVDHLKKIIENGEYRKYSKKRGDVA